MNSCADRVRNLCTECIHNPVCYISDMPKDPDTGIKKQCRYFMVNDKDKYTFNIQDKVYYVTGIHNSIVKEATIIGLYFGVHGIEDVTVLNEDWVTFNNFPTIFYKTREEAEKHVNKQQKLNEDQFFEKYCSLCGTQRCEGPGSPMFQGCLYRSELEKDD